MFNTNKKLVYSNYLNFNNELTIPPGTVFIEENGQKVPVTVSPVHPENDVYSYMSEPFKLEEGIKSVEIEMSAPISNNWVSSSLELINEKTGDVYFVDKDLEYYFGYTDGEHWTEGSASESQFISSVPEGKYRLSISVMVNKDAPVESFSIYVYRDVPIWINFWISLLILWAYPIYLYYRSQSFEKKRWFNSNYSPYETE